MRDRQRSRTAVRAVGALATAAALAVLGACGGQDAGSGGAAAAADPAMVQKATDSTTALGEPPTFALTDADKIDPAGAAGKKLWIIDIASSIPLVQVSDAATAQALGLVGATVKTYDGKGSVTEYTRGIQAAIADKADVIALYAIDPNLVAGPIQAAADAGIKVIVVQYDDPGAPLPKNVTAQVTYPYTQAGAAMANFIVADSKGAAVGVEFISASDVSNSKAIVGGFQDTLKAACPNCSVTVDDVPVADWQTKITTQVNSTLNSHPDIKYVVPVYDGMATFAIPAIKTSGKKDVKLVSFNATKSIMQNLKDGDTVVADVGSPQAWEGWALADQFIRVVTNAAPLVDTKVGLRMFTGQNIGRIDLAAPESTWYGVDYESGYKKLWGVSQ
ncbi:sugar ABC transporter substrate-binding protein [Pseudonocardia sp.]|uniref:sugar ABC transporter substrate-binding protein n=1 Tax=Pseudonocardia sp. TaxID=60912 RepID=UPI003D098DCE